MTHCKPKRRKLFRSGNNSPWPQWVYVGIHMLFYIIPVPFWFKFGIGGSFLDRLNGVSGTIPGFVLPIFVAYVPWAWHFEQWAHRKMDFFRFTYFGSGKTEWFVVFAIVFAIPVLCAYFLLIWGLVGFVGAYLTGNEKAAYEALKWVADNPMLFIHFVIIGKLVVIIGHCLPRLKKGR